MNNDRKLVAKVAMPFRYVCDVNVKAPTGVEEAGKV